jgi:hypothetical protein
MFDPDHLIKTLREYGATQHGKRAGLHHEISKAVFFHPEKVADLIEAGMRGDLLSSPRVQDAIAPFVKPYK